MSAFFTRPLEGIVIHKSLKTIGLKMALNMAESEYFTVVKKDIEGWHIK
jgi:hypothetical protein